MSLSNDRKIKFLRKAVTSGDLSWVEALLQNNVNPNTVIDDGQPALHYICCQNKLTRTHFKMIQSFIRCGADVDIQNKLGDSPIITLYRQTEDCEFRLQVFELLLGAGADVTCVDRDGNTVLHWIVRKKINQGIVEAVKWSLDNGLDVNIQNTMGQSALHVALKHNSRNLEIVELLLKNGADPNAIDTGRRTALDLICAHFKLEKVHLKMIERLIDYEADVNILDKRGYSPIMTLYNGAKNFKLRLDIFKLLLEVGADVTFVDNAGDTILHLILCNKENPNILEAVKLSLEYGLDVNIQNEKGQSALHLASLHCECIKVVKLLLKNGADPNVVDNDGWTALNYICAKPTLKAVHLKMIQLLIQYTADVNIQNVYGDSPIMSLYIAEDYNLRFKVFSLLLEAGAVVTYLNEGRNTMFHIILYNPKNQSVTKEMEVLLKSGVDVHTQNKKGYSALHFAVIFSEPLEVLEQLLKNRADPNAVDENGWTALHRICAHPKLEKVHLKMIERLIEYRANVNIANNDGERPIMTLYNGAKDFKLRLDVFKLLLKAGADVTHVNLEGNTILNYILYNGKDPNIVEAVEWSLNHGSAVNIKNKLGQSALHFAVTFSQSLEVIKLLLERDANPNTVDNNGRTAMNYICLKPGMKKVNYKMIETLIEKGANVNIHDNFGDSPITNLFALGDCLVSELKLRLNAFRLLLQKGAVCQRSNVFDRYVSYNFDKADPLGDTSDVVKEVQYLLKTGMNVNKRDEEGRSPLHKAICELRIEHVQFLFRNGADPNIVDAYGNIPLNYTFERFEHADMTFQFKIFLRILELNIKSNVDLSHIGSNGKTVLHLLIIKVSTFFLRTDKKDELAKVSEYVLQYIEILLKHGLDINIKNRDGFTPLNEAVSHCNYCIAQFLVKHGADVNTVNFKGGFLENEVLQSLNLATTLNLLDIIKLLRGKKFKIKPNQYLTLFKYLTLYENVHINYRLYSELLDVWTTTDPSMEQCFFYDDIFQLDNCNQQLK
uniref:Uncharacterized protein n=1 Tax=Trichogramma kaykai TaxID=54128 RepID=A0ABD2WC48_9HYME